ncbi:hypothetical protein NG796_05610 [Laspinema sp. A4]|uniref:hypothetical protein n=1 Tax=Laspinema sp. D2d TaxID=2953686 RepID=UPI0021BB84D6|nr:hypothetical protein [Laspinema sp. D2d]MCT7982768.1 hypothetical protein [Laspinema sp. D2d]
MAKIKTERSPENKRSLSRLGGRKMTPPTDANPRILLIFVPEKFVSGDRHPKNTAYGNSATGTIRP